MVTKNNEIAQKNNRNKTNNQNKLNHKNNESVKSETIKTDKKIKENIVVEERQKNNENNIEQKNSKIFVDNKDLKEVETKKESKKENGNTIKTTQNKNENETENKTDNKVKNKSENITDSKKKNDEEKESKSDIEKLFMSDEDNCKINDENKDVITHKWWVDALIFVGGTMVLGLLAKLLGGEMFGFKGYEMPPATASAKVFPVIWIIIYIAIGVSTYLMWRDKEIKEVDRKINLILFIAQMFFNILWPLFFFRLDLPIFAVVWLILLIGLSCACMYRYFICNLPAGIIFNLYTLWLIYALYLNLGLVLLNFC